MPELVLEGPTRYLSTLHCHLSRLAPGAGYKTHADPYDVAIVLLAGTIAINGKILEETAVLYYAAGELHDMSNPCETVVT